MMIFNRLIYLFLLIALPLIAQSEPASISELTKTVVDQQNPPKNNPAMVSKLAVLAGLSLLPFAIMLLTSFMKIVVVLSLMRSALGLSQTPPNQVINAIGLLMTIYVMFPTAFAMYKAADVAIQAYPRTEVLSSDSSLFVISVIDKAKKPLQSFLERNCNPGHIRRIYAIALKVFPEPYKNLIQPNDFLILIPSFVISQLKTAFEVGVLIYLPFFVIDLVVSNILLAMGMMMLSPLTIALPIKLLLLVVIDGWTLLIQSLVMTFK